ncbi:MAG: 3-phosphoshikimate 1-carboxyvinyltransferase [Bacteroidales bacterium]|nr:3-phosphoshikimate 1-carboxyvinyltransferase [Bacteroidales bacterium]
MRLTVDPSFSGGSITAPASKSAMQRYVACALLAEGTCEILNPSYCDDARAAIGMAECLGADISELPGRIIIQGGFKPQCNKLFCGESGLGARVFSVLAALHDDWIELRGEGSILSRPFNMLADTLRPMGVEVISNKDLLPVKIKGPIKGGTAMVDGSVSSQFLSGMLLALPLVQNDSHLIVNNLSSKPYIDLTIQVLHDFGISIDNRDYRSFFINGAQQYKPGTYRVEGDWSGAAFLLVLGAVAGNIEVRGLRPSSSQSDKYIVDLLKRAGADVIVNDYSVKVKKNRLDSFIADISDCPDLAPPLAVLASFCDGKTILTGTGRLKVKESDRGKVLEKELGKMGVKIVNYDNHMEIAGPSEIIGGMCDSHGDHRIAMALVTLAVGAEQKIALSGAEAVNKSYPDFYDHMRRLGISISKL